MAKKQSGRNYLKVLARSNADRPIEDAPALVIGYFAQPERHLELTTPLGA